MSQVTLLDLEGLALNGLVVDVEIVDCGGGTPRRSRLRVKLADGKVVETECGLYERVVRSYLIMKKYVEFGKIISGKELSEEVIKSLKFDVE